MSKVDGIIRQIPRQVRRIPRMIGNDTRFAIIISLMKKNEMSFSELQDELGIKISELTYQLNILINEGWLDSSYEKRKNKNDFNFYRLTNWSKKVMDKLFAVLEPDRYEEFKDRLE